MTLQTTSIDYFMAALFADYLALNHDAWMALRNVTPTDVTRAMDLPDALPRVVVDSGKPIVYPSVIVAAKEMPENTQCRREILVSCALMTWQKPDDPSAATSASQLTRAQSAALQAAVETRLRDHCAFNAFLALQSSDRLSGWNILNRLKIANVMPENDRTLRTIHFATTVHLVVAVARSVV